MLHESKASRELTKKKLADLGIKVVHDARIAKIEADGIILTDGRIIPCNVPVWATGAEPQKVTVRSNLEILDGYFRVNDYLQSSSHSNVFAGGDCITMESYSNTVYPDQPRRTFPPKAGVYAVREGPIIA